MKYFKFLIAMILVFCTIGMPIFAQADAADEMIDDLTTEKITSTVETTTMTKATTTTTTTPTTTTTTTTTTTPTTTSTPTTTTAPTTKPTTAPLPPSNDAYVYNVTEHNVTCIMVDADFNFLVTYNIGGNQTNQTTVHMPTPKDKKHVIVDGSCNSTEVGFEGTQYIELTWGESIPQNSVKLRFNQSSDGKTWHLLKFRSTLYMGKDEFKNATDGGKSLYSIMHFDINPINIPVNNSFLCYAKFEVNNVTTLMENITYIYPVALNVGGIQLQAFNKLPLENKFVDEVHCEADKIADIVPIAVGCALAVLIIIVLVAYIVGRRRRSAAYQSV